MRSYAKNFVYKQTASYKQRQERLATEWDIRVDVNDVLPVERVVSNIKERLDDILFVLVSGVERPDTEGPGAFDKNKNHSGSNEHHVHLCLVLFTPVRRRDVLELVRGPRKLGDEYCAPRNPKFTYAGWVIHHGKPGFKVAGEPLVRFEHGTLPLDPVTTDTAVKVTAILKKWGTDGTRKRFAMYTELLKRDKIRSKIEQLQMSLEDHE